MTENNKLILETGNAAITNGDNEGFLTLCAEDTVWNFVGDRTLRGKEAVRDWMKTAYVVPPEFTVRNFIAEGDFVTAMGTIRLRDEAGKMSDYSYCDVWTFRDGKITELNAFVIKTS